MVNEVATNISGEGGTWQPKWFMDIGNQCQVGIDIDDHCFVVLTKNIVGSWTPSEWIPPKVAIRLGELAKSESVL
jgi:hypothetical protein